MDRLPFVKGHGTQNDFVLLPDHDDEIQLDAALVRALCDRRAGIGGDGVLRAVRGDGGWFMDYRNADGSVAETCGNGIRVFARYLVSAGLLPAGELTIGTRAGVRAVSVPAAGGDITVGMGAPEELPDAVVDGPAGRFSAVGVSMGNPHLVVLDAGDLDDLDLSIAPTVEPAAAYPEGANVEFVHPGTSSLRMRVFERGVGETRSCGTGACAVAVATMRARDERTTYDVDLPGGRLRVAWREDGEVLLSGPAVLVATGEIELSALRAACHHAGNGAG